MEIYVKPSGFDDALISYKKLNDNLKSVESQLKNIIKGLDIEVKAQAGVLAASNNLSKQIEKAENAISSHSSFIEYAAEMYSAAESRQIRLTAELNRFYLSQGSADSYSDLITSDISDLIKNILHKGVTFFDFMPYMTCPNMANFHGVIEDLLMSPVPQLEFYNNYNILSAASSVLSVLPIGEMWDTFKSEIGAIKGVKGIGDLLGSIDKSGDVSKIFGWTSNTSLKNLFKEVGYVEDAGKVIEAFVNKDYDSLIDLGEEYGEKIFNKGVEYTTGLKGPELKLITKSLGNLIENVLDVDDYVSNTGKGSFKGFFDYVGHVVFDTASEGFFDTVHSYSDPITKFLYGQTYDEFCAEYGYHPIQGIGDVFYNGKLFTERVINFMDKGYYKEVPAVVCDWVSTGIDKAAKAVKGLFNIF